jgi:branched-chain amino acid transport system substrate-binding protein
VFVEALKAVDQKNKISSLSLEQLREQLNQAILSGKYQTVLGNLSFTPEGEIIQEQFYVAQIKMDETGENGKFTYLK